jgi:hypothetical protein
LSGKVLALLVLEDVMTTIIAEQRDRPAEHGIPANVHVVASARTLDGFGFDLRDADGVDIRELAAGTTLIAQTRHSRYRLVVLDPNAQRMLVSGGDWFPVPTEAQLVGATCGGSMLRPGWIGVGLKLELRHMDRRITTTLVAELTVEPSPLEAI